MLLRKLIPLTLVVSILFSFSGVVGFASLAHAQATGSSSSTGSSQTSSVANNGSKVTDSPVVPADNGQSVTQKAFGPVMSAIMNLFAWLMGTAAIVLDNAVYYTVATMGNYVHNLSAIGVVWQILRDLGNLVLIFGFLAVGITTILDVNWYGGGTKFLPTLLMVAVLLNFSLFLSEAVVDIGNMFGTEIYKQINGGTTAQSTSVNITNIKNEGISTKILDNLGLQTIYGQALDNANNVLFSGSNEFFIGFMGAILFLIAAFVMFSLAFVLIARFVVLLFLIMISPIGIAGYAIPKMASYAKQWQGQLISQAFVAPIMLLLLYVALRVITDASFLQGFVGTGGASGAWTGWLTGSVGSYAGILLSFIIAMGLLLAVVVYSKKLGGASAGFANRISNRLTVGLAASTAAFAGRNTIGRGSSYLSRRLSRSKFGRTDLGRKIAGNLDNGAKKTYDFRNTSQVKALAKNSFVKSSGLDLAGGSKKSYEGTREQNIAARKKYAGTLKLTKDEEAKLAEAKKQKDALKGIDGKGGQIAAQQQQVDADKKALNERVSEHKNDMTELEKKQKTERDQLKAAADKDQSNIRDVADIERAKKKEEEGKERLNEDRRYEDELRTHEQYEKKNLAPVESEISIKEQQIAKLKSDLATVQTEEGKKAIANAEEELKTLQSHKVNTQNGLAAGRTNIVKKHQKAVDDIEKKYNAEYDQIDSKLTKDLQDRTDKYTNDLDQLNKDQKAEQDTKQKIHENEQQGLAAAHKASEETLKALKDNLENVERGIKLSATTAKEQYVANMGVSPFMTSQLFGSGTKDSIAAIKKEIEKSGSAKLKDAMKIIRQNAAERGEEVEEENKAAAGTSTTNPPPAAGAAASGQTKP